MQSLKIAVFILVLPLTVIFGDDHDINVNGTVYRDGADIPLQGANVIFVNKSGEELPYRGGLMLTYKLSK